MEATRPTPHPPVPSHPETGGWGVVLEGVGGRYLVLLEGAGGAPVEASLRGRVKREVRTGDRVVAGDRVRLEPEGGGSFTIEEVGERRSELVRAGPRGHRPKLVAANVDGILAVQSIEEPPLRRELVDRFLVLAEGCGIPPTLVINKLDLGEGEAGEHAGFYRSLGYPVLLTSAASGAGIGELADLLRTGAFVLVGPSGVGKSTLLNRIEPDLRLRTGEVSRRAGQGKHTTVSARLIPLRQGGAVVDTPGFSDLALWGIDPVRLTECFPEFDEHGEGCRFRGCSHLHEPGCGVREALERGEIDPGRFESYRQLMTDDDPGGRAG